MRYSAAEKKRDYSTGAEFESGHTSFPGTTGYTQIYIL